MGFVLGDGVLSLEGVPSALLAILLNRKLSGVCLRLCLSGYLYVCKGWCGCILMSPNFERWKNFLMIVVMSSSGEEL